MSLVDDVDEFAIGATRQAFVDAALSATEPEQRAWNEILAEIIPPMDRAMYKYVPVLGKEDAYTLVMNVASSLLVHAIVNLRRDVPSDLELLASDFDKHLREKITTVEMPVVAVDVETRRPL